MARDETGKIRFNYLERTIRLPDRTKLKAFILKLFKNEGVRVTEVNYIFCSDEYLLGINQQFLRHNSYTDIVTFQYTGKGEAVQSDIYISVDRVRENAGKFGVSFLKELYRVVFHGALHLCEYKDKKSKDSQQMRVKEEYYLSRYVPRGT